MFSEWHNLEVPHGKGERPWIVRHSFSSDGYTVEVTDFSQIWSESLNKRQILQRAKDSGSSIDPEEGQSQLDILLQKIKAAIEAEEGTKVKLDGKPDAARLTLSIQSSLPEPLQPLHWPIHLSRQPAHSMKSELVLPLVSLSYARYKQIEDLVRFLQEKDNAMRKMLDKIESLGIDLSNVFPNAATGRSGKKSNDREQIVKQVRGLSAFDREKWMESAGSAEPSDCSLQDLIQVAFRGSGSSSVQSLAESLDLGQIPFSKTDNYDSSHRQGKRGAGTQDDSQLESQPDEFQRQSTPSKKDAAEDASTTNKGYDLRGSPSERDQAPQATEDDETTEDEEEGEEAAADDSKDVPSKSRQDPQDSTPSKTTGGTPSKKLGIIGGRKSKVSEDNGDAKMADDEPERPASKQSDAASPKPATRKLGQIGGRQTRQSRHTPDPDLSSNTHAKAAEAETPSTMQGSATATQEEGSPQSKPATGSRSSPATAPVPPPPQDVEPETAQEKADRKREELKRDLEDSSKTQAKKKRRF